MSQVSYGTITITDTNDIERIYVVFAKSDNPDTAPSMAASTWTEDITQAPGTGDYIWQRTVVKKSGPTSSTNPSYSDPVRLTGEEGNPAKEIIAVETQYGTSANWNTQPVNWTADVPTYDENNPKYWIRTRLKYEDNTYSDWVSSKDNGLTDAMAIANEALAQSEEALQTAIQVDTLLGGHFIYGGALPQTTPAGARVVEQIEEGTTDVSGNPSKWHHNVTIGSNGIQLRYNEAVMAQIAANQSGSDTALKFYQPPTVSGNTTTQGALTMELSGNALKFYNPTTGNAQMIVGANGTLQSGNYSRGSDTKFAASGTKIDLTYGDIITKYFRLSQGAEAGGPNAGAYIYGTIEALDGKIGQGYTNNGALTNYWEIGNSTDYLLHRSAKIIGHGSSFIQLGDDSTWRLATNRIHTGWYEESIDSYLHFPEFIDGINSKYWDYGLHVPSSRSDKFIYIRNASGNSSLDSLVNDLEDTQNPSIWTYQFWVDGSGNVHAPGFYIGNSSTPIGGGTGTVAEKLMSGAGSSTRPVYVRSDTVDGVNYTGVVAPVSWDVNGSISADSTTNDNNIATIEAIKTYVTGRGYVTSSGITSVTIAATNPVVSSTSTTQTGASVSTTISLTNGYGDTQNPYGSKTKNYVLAAPSNAAGVPSFRLLVASDIPDLSATYLTSHQTVTNKSATLAWGTSKTVATIGNTDITVSLPSNPDTNTTYTFSSGTNQFTVTPSSGSAYDVTITPSIINNVTGSGTNGSLAKWSGTNTLTDGPAFTSGGTGFLKQDGTWGTPGGTYSLPIAKYNTLGGVKPAYSSTGAATLTTAAATNATTPIIAAKTTTSDRYYAIEIDKNGVLFVNVPWTNVNSSYLTGITFNDVTTALNYTPYNSTNPNGYTTNTGTVTSVRVQASSPLQSSTSTTQSTSLNTTISFINQDANKILAGPSSGNATAPSFRSLVAADIPNLSWNKITSDKPTTLSGYGITDAADLTAITGVEISDAQLTITRANGTSTSTSVTITASQATGATKLIKIVNNTPQDAAAGSETLPVYFTGGYPQAVTSIAKLNGAATTYPEFYAPVSAGTSGYVLKSNGSGAPTWIPQSDISSGNTYTTTIAADSGTNQLTLAHGTKYKLTAGGTGFVFTMPSDSDKKLEVAAVTSSTTYYPIVGTGTTAATRQYDTTGLVYVGTNGTANGTNGNALLTLGNNTASTTANWKKGTIRLYGTTAYYTDIVSGAPTANRTITLPNTTGTVALTSDLTWGTVTGKPTNTGSSTTGITIADHGTTSVGSASNWSAGTASSWEFENKTVATAASSATSIPNVTSVGSASSWSFTDVTVPIRADSATTVPTAASSATACDDITAWSAGSGSATLSFSINGTETTNGNQLDISFSHSHTAPTLTYTARSITGVSGSTSVYGVKSGTNSTTTASKASGSNGTAPTLGTAISITGVGGTTTVSSKKSGSNSTVPSLTITSTTVVNGKSHTITDAGHTHTI